MGPTISSFSEDLLNRFFGHHLLIDRKFQLKYTAILLVAVLGAMVPVSFINLYFLNENYRIFIDMSLNQRPDLLAHLEREKIWINVFVITLIFGVSVFCVYYGLRLTARLIAPITAMKEHLKSLTRGNWGISDIEPIDTDEFYDLLEAYHYFYKSLRHQQKSEIDRLKQIFPKTDSTEKIWKDLISEKSRRLN